ALPLTVELTAGPGRALVVRDRKRLVLHPGGLAPDRRLTFTSDRQAPGGEFLVVPAERPRVHVMTTLEVVGRQLRFVSRIDAGVRDTALRRLGVHLAGWPGEEVRLEAPAPARQ